MVDGQRYSSGAALTVVGWKEGTHLYERELEENRLELTSSLPFLSTFLVNCLGDFLFQGEI